MLNQIRRLGGVSMKGISDDEDGTHHEIEAICRVTMRRFADHENVVLDQRRRTG